MHSQNLPSVLAAALLLAAGVAAEPHVVNYDCAKMPGICTNHCWAINCMGHPEMLTYDNARTSDQARTEWGYGHKAALKPFEKPPFDSPEEYPLANSQQGGLSYNGKSVSLRMVTLDEQHIQNSLVSSAKTWQSYMFRLKNVDKIPASYGDYCYARTQCDPDNKQFVADAKGVFRYAEKEKDVVKNHLRYDLGGAPGSPTPGGMCKRNAGEICYTRPQSPGAVTKTKLPQTKTAASKTNPPPGGAGAIPKANPLAPLAPAPLSKTNPLPVGGANAAPKTNPLALPAPGTGLRRTSSFPVGGANAAPKTNPLAPPALGTGLRRTNSLPAGRVAAAAPKQNAPLTGGAGAAQRTGGKAAARRV
ncbi:hypothetical protein PspLS_11854 [Pyricularia sp. CBS 133598]|nr:hypothetical protein PspLS_11854 [Pyricularia sp. CBS 133598]